MSVTISKKQLLEIVKALAHYETLVQRRDFYRIEFDKDRPRSVVDGDLKDQLEALLVDDEQVACSDAGCVDCYDATCAGDDGEEEEEEEEKEEDVEDIVIHRNMVSSDDLIDLPTITMMVSSSDTLDLSEKKGLQFFVEDGEINVEFGSTTLYDITVVERTAKELTVFSEDTRSNHTFSTSKFPKRWTSLLACNKPYSVRFNTEEGSEW